MAWYDGIVEHDTGLHADAEQYTNGQQMLKVEITLAEYRKLVKESAEAEYKLSEAKCTTKACKQKLYDVLKQCDDANIISPLWKEELRVLSSDYEIRK